MAIDFRNYQDPGVRVEVVDSPVLDTAGLEPTIIALVGKSQGSQDVSGGAFLYNSQPTTLVDYVGIDAQSLRFANQRGTSSYYSGAIGRVIRAGVQSGNYALGTDPLTAYITPFITLPIFDGSKQGGTPSTVASASTAGKYNIVVGTGNTAQTGTLVVIDDTTWKITGLSTAVDVGQLICIDKTYQTPVVQIAETGAPESNTATRDWVLRSDGTWEVKLFLETVAADLPNIFHVNWEEVDDDASFIEPADSFKITIDLDGVNGQQDAAQETALITVAADAVDTIDADKLQEDITAALEALIWQSTPNPDVLLTGKVNVFDVNEYGFWVEFDKDVVFEANSPLLITTATFGGDATHGQVTGWTNIPNTLGVPNAGFQFLQFGNSTYTSNERVRVIEVLQSGTGFQYLHVERGVQGSMINHKTPSNTPVYHISSLDADIQLALDGGADNNLETDTDNVPVIETLDDGVLEPRITGSSTAISLSGQVSPESYYSATTLDNLQDIQEKYGAEWGTDGATINSDLTLAASLAFANGASQVVLQAVKPDTDGNYGYVEWTEAISKLAFNPEVNVIVPLIDAASEVGATVIDYLKNDIREQANDGVLRRAFIGLDGLSYAYGASTFENQAQQINDERISLVAPGYITVKNNTGSGQSSIPGYFAASAVSGIQSIIAPQEPLTRKMVYGLTTLERLSSTDAVDMQSSGVLVLWQDRLGRILIKHGLTTDMSTVYTREASIITARDRLRDLIYDTLDKGHLIGSAMTSDTPNQVMGGVTAALDNAVTSGLIFDYGDVVYRINPIEPTAIEIRFAYKPTMPLNYIIVQFHIDTTLGTLEFQSVTTSSPIPGGFTGETTITL